MQFFSFLAVNPIFFAGEYQRAWLPKGRLWTCSVQVQLWRLWSECMQKSGTRNNNTKMVMIMMPLHEFFKVMHKFFQSAPNSCHKPHHNSFRSSAQEEVTIMGIVVYKKSLENVRWWLVIWRMETTSHTISCSSLSSQGKSRHITPKVRVKALRCDDDVYSVGTHKTLHTQSRIMLHCSDESQMCSRSFLFTYELLILSSMIWRDEINNWVLWNCMLHFFLRLRCS